MKNLNHEPIVKSGRWRFDRVRWNRETLKEESTRSSWWWQNKKRNKTRNKEGPNKQEVSKSDTDTDTAKIHS